MYLKEREEVGLRGGELRGGPRRRRGVGRRRRCCQLTERRQQQIVLRGVSTDWRENNKDRVEVQTTAMSARRRQEG